MDQCELRQMKKVYVCGGCSEKREQFISELDCKYVGKKEGEKGRMGAGRNCGEP